MHNILTVKSVPDDFWSYLEQLVATSPIIIDRKKGTAHPRFPDFIYPVDYGYLEGTTTVDGNGVDIWVGTAATKNIDAVICTCDLFKKDVEVKILYACTEEEKKIIHEILNKKMRALLIYREKRT